MKAKSRSFHLLLIILLLAAVLRFTGLNWDSGFHLHPDERFLSLVGNDIHIPSSVLQYFDPSTSSLNPSNVGYKFFVYGAFPLILNKFLAVGFGNDSYAMFHLQGRVFSALADLLVVFFVFKTVEIFEKRYKLSSRIKFLAAFFYAIAVLPIQLAHFFTVDSFLVCFAFGSLFFALKTTDSVNKKTGLVYLVLSAVLFGLAFATKVTAIFILPLNLWFITYLNINRRNSSFFILYSFFIYAIISYLTVRVADPYLFQNGSLFDPRISTQFFESLKTLKSLDRPDAWFPPGVQWIHKTPVIYSLINLAVFGLGLPYFIVFVFGLWISNKKQDAILPIILWMVTLFLYQSAQFAQPIRYLNLLYPFIAIFAAVGLDYIIGKLRITNYGLLRSTFYVLCFLILLLWPAAFLNIYLRPHSRVAASEWLYQHLPTNSIILAEYWDDALPLPMKEKYGKDFVIEQLPVFDPDTDEKWEKLNTLFDTGNYYVLSSNRGWGSIPTAPERYPRMSRFYMDLFAGKTPYKKIKEFTSYPSFEYFGIPIEFPDQWSDEAFTVYDHPKVIIFKKS